MQTLANSFYILAFALGISCLQALAQTSTDQYVNFAIAKQRSAVVCPSPAMAMTSDGAILTIPRALFERAKLKSRLGKLLRESIYDDAQGIVNVPREKEIRKLANELRRSP